MYSLIGRQKWWVQLLITIALIASTITIYLYSSSRGYDKARAAFEAADKVKAEQSTEKIARAEFLEQRVAELEPKLAAFEKLDDEKAKLSGSITEQLNAVVVEGQKRDEATNAPTDCGTHADNTCAKLRTLQPPIAIDCAEYKRRICATAVGSGCK